VPLLPRQTGPRSRSLRPRPSQRALFIQAKQSLGPASPPRQAARQARAARPRRQTQRGGRSSRLKSTPWTPLARAASGRTDWTREISSQWSGWVFTSSGNRNMMKTVMAVDSLRPPTDVNALPQLRSIITSSIRLPILWRSFIFISITTCGRRQRYLGDRPPPWARQGTHRLLHHRHRRAASRRRSWTARPRSWRTATSASSTT
jgi:hypothetical protein